MTEIKIKNKPVKIKLLLYSDFVCPFCHIAEQSSLQKLQKKFPIEINWRGFELHPETPIGGMEISDLFPGKDLQSMREYMSGFADSFGVSLKFSSRIANTRRALAMAEYAREKNQLEPFRNGAMKAYWEEGKNLEDPETLSAIAQSAGLDPVEALSASLDSKFIDTIDAVRAEANKKKVSGIPTFIFEDETIIAGCQPYQVFENAIKQFL